MDRDNGIRAEKRKPSAAKAREIKRVKEDQENRNIEEMERSRHMVMHGEHIGEDISVNDGGHGGDGSSSSSGSNNSSGNNGSGNSGSSSGSGGTNSGFHGEFICGFT